MPAVVVLSSSDPIMSLYDDDDVALTAPKDSSAVTGWGKSASWQQMQQTKSLAALKKVAAAKASLPAVAATTVVAPVVNLKSNKRSSLPVTPQTEVDTAPRFSFGGDKAVRKYQ